MDSTQDSTHNTAIKKIKKNTKKTALKKDTFHILKVGYGLTCVNIMK